jgi:hypothetical protein
VFGVEVDLSELLAVGDEARAELRTVPAAMRRIGADAAKASRQDHLYQNRTGATQAHTRSVSEHTGNATYTLVEIAVPHASYLMQDGTSRRHVSLTGLEVAIERATTELEFFMDGLGSGLDR